MKAFRLSKNNFLSIFNLIANQKWNSPSIFYGKQQIFERLSIISIKTRVFEIWKSPTLSGWWLDLGQVWGINWQTYWRSIIKIINSLDYEFPGYNFHYLFILCKTKTYNSILSFRNLHIFIGFWQIRRLKSEGGKVNVTNFAI